MMNLLATVGATLPLLVGGGDNVPFYMAELGGAVVEQQSGQPFQSPVPVSIRLQSNGECIAGTSAGLDGRYTLRAPPGEYWAQILLGKEEVLAEKVMLAAGSSQKDFRVPSAVTTPARSPEASGSNPESAGIGGSSLAGQGVFNGAHRAELLVPSLRPVPKRRGGRCRCFGAASPPTLGWNSTGPTSPAGSPRWGSRLSGQLGELSSEMKPSALAAGEDIEGAADSAMAAIKSDRTLQVAYDMSSPQSRLEHAGDETPFDLSHLHRESRTALEFALVALAHPERIEASTKHVGRLERVAQRAPCQGQGLDRMGVRGVVAAEHCHAEE